MGNTPILNSIFLQNGNLLIFIFLIDFKIIAEKTTMGDNNISTIGNNLTTIFSILIC